MAYGFKTFFEIQRLVAGTISSFSLAANSFIFLQKENGPGKQSSQGPKGIFPKNYLTIRKNSVESKSKLRTINTTERNRNINAFVGQNDRLASKETIAPAIAKIATTIVSIVISIHLL